MNGYCPAEKSGCLVGRNMRALIIEDDQNAAGFLAKVLREERFAVDITQLR